MEQEKILSLYDRLLAIKISIDADPVSRPGYINEKIWECHHYIEEVEGYHIEMSKEMSTRQQALNNATAAYQTKKEELLSDEKIQQLSSIKDREARVNQRLQEELVTIRTYENELTALNNLLRAVDLKMKNLNRVNGDIRLQVRVLEQQIKLNALPQTDKVASDFVEEMNRTSRGEDAFEGSESAVEEENVVDPSSPLDIESLLKDGESDIDIKSLINPVPDLDPGENGVNPSEDEEEDEIGEPDDLYIPDGAETPLEEESTTETIDLDQILGGGEPTQAESVIKPEVIETQKEEQGGEQEETALNPDQKSEPEAQNSQSSGGLDIDDLLDTIIQKERAS